MVGFHWQVWTPAVVAALAAVAHANSALDMQLDVLKEHCSSEAYDKCQQSAIEELGKCSGSELECHCHALVMVRETCRDTCSTSLDDAVAKYVAAACPPSSEIETAGWRRKYLQKLRFLTSDDDEDDDCTGEDDDGWMEDTWNDDIFAKRSVKRSVDADDDSETATETVISSDEVVAESSSSGNAAPEMRLHADPPGNVNRAKPFPGDDEDDDCDGPEEEEEEDEEDDDDCDNGDDSDDGSRYHKYTPAGYQYPRESASYPPPVAAEYPPSNAPPSVPPPVPPAAPGAPIQPAEPVKKPLHPSVETIDIPREAISIYEPMSQSDKYMKAPRDEKIWDNSVGAEDVMQSADKRSMTEGQANEANIAGRDIDDDDHASLRAKLASVSDQSPVIQARLASLLNFPLPAADKLFCQRQKGGSLCWIPDFGGDNSDECGESGGCEDEGSSSSWKDKFNFCKGGFCFGFNKNNGKDSESDNCSGDSCVDDRPAPCSGDECSGDREHENERPEPVPECHPTDSSCNDLMTGGPKRPTPTNVYGPDRHHEEPYPGPPRYTRPPSTSIFECPESGDCDGYLYEECSGSACRNLLQSPPENLIKTTAIPVSDAEKDVESVVSGPEDQIKEGPSAADSDAGSKVDDSTKTNDVADQAIGGMDETKDNKDSEAQLKSDESTKERTTEPARKAQETKVPGSEDKVRAKLDSRMDKLKKNVKDAAGIADNKFKKVVSAYNSTNHSSSINWTTTGNYSAVKMQSAGAQLSTPMYEIVLATLLSVVSSILFL